MKRKSVVPEVPGINLAFRPKSYFWPLGLGTHLLARVKGAERKAALQRLIDSRNLDSVPAFLAQSALGDEDRRAIGAIQPSLLGGEYLPDLTRREVEIARITIDSVTQDVTSVYARRGRNRIYYRVVDEYEGETLGEANRRTSSRPLTLGELETFFNGAWSIFDVLAMNFGCEGYDVEDILFFATVESQFYAQIDTLYRYRIEAWADVQRAKLGLERREVDLERAAKDRVHPNKGVELIEILQKRADATLTAEEALATKRDRPTCDGMNSEIKALQKERERTPAEEEALAAKRPRPVDKPSDVADGS